LEHSIKQYDELLKKNIELIKQNENLLYALALILPGGFILLGYLLFDKNQRLIREAKKYIGQEEIDGNKGFINSEFQTLMHEYGGYNKGEEWCMRFASMIYEIKLGKNSRYATSLEYCLTGSTQTSFQRFKDYKEGYFKVSQTPSKGAIVIWCKSRGGVCVDWKGHAGIVQKVTADGFETIEGNVNYDDNGNFISEGIVAERSYNLQKEIKRTDGNRLKGFIKLI